MSQSREEAKVSIRITDADLQKAGWAKFDYQPVDTNQIGTPVHTSQIAQAGMGNCFLVAAISTIVENDPIFLNNMITLSNDGKTAEVTFRHANRDITYVIDATKMSRIRGMFNMGESDLNNHSHDAMYLLEKAYAIHRIFTDTVDKDKEVKHLGKNIEFAVTTTSPSTSQPSTQIKAVEMIEYRSALAGGLPSDVFSELKLPGKNYGVSAGEELKGMSDITKYCAEGKMDITGASIFKNKLFFNDAELTNQFMQYAKGLNKDQLRVLSDFFVKAYDVAQKDRMLTLDQLGAAYNQLYQKMFNGGDKSPPMMDDVLKQAFMKGLVDNSPHRKRGLAEYTREQTELYAKMHDLIGAGHLMAAETKDFKVGEGDRGVGEGLTKGLVGTHAFEVVDCYERGDMKFVLVRNPWSNYVRDYEEKERTTPAGDTVRVLSAVEREQLKDNAQSNAFRDRYHVKESARGLSSEDVEGKYRSQGYFEVELTDFGKRFQKVHHTVQPVTPGIQAEVFGSTIQMLKNAADLMTGDVKNKSPEGSRRASMDAPREVEIDLKPGSPVEKRTMTREQMLEKERRAQQQQQYNRLEANTAAPTGKETKKASQGNLLEAAKERIQRALGGKSGVDQENQGDNTKNRKFR